MKCDACGRFMRQVPGSSYAMRYSGWPLCPDHEAFRCKACTDNLGQIPHQHGTQPWTAGVVLE